MRNMHRTIGMAVLFSIGLFATTLTAAQEETKGADGRRHLEVHPVGAVHRMGDWFATRRMPKEQRRSAMEQRKAEREVRYAEEKIKRDQRWAEKKTILDADKKSRAR